MESHSDWNSYNMDGMTNMDNMDEYAHDPGPGPANSRSSGSVDQLKPNQMEHNHLEKSPQNTAEMNSLVLDSVMADHMSDHGSMVDNHRQNHHQNHEHHHEHSQQTLENHSQSQGLHQHQHQHQHQGNHSEFFDFNMAGSGASGDKPQGDLNAFLQSLLTEEHDDSEDLANTSTAPHSHHESPFLTPVSHPQRSVNPTDIFCSPILDPMNSSRHDANRTAGSSSFNEFTPLLSPTSTGMDPSQQGMNLPPDFVMPDSYLETVDETQQQQQPIESRPRSRRASSSKPRSSSNRTTPIMAANSSVPGRVAKMSPVIRASTNKRMSSFQNLPQNLSQSRQTYPSDPGSVSSDSISPPESLMMPPPPQSSSSAAAIRSRSRSGSASGPVSRHSSLSSNASNSTIPITPASLMNLPPGEAPNLNAISAAISEERLETAIRATSNASFSSERRRSSSSSVRSSPSLSTPPIRPKPPVSTWKSTKNSVNGAKNNGRRKDSVSSSTKKPITATSHGISPKLLANGSANNGTLNDPDDLSEMLAAKSNYQNIVEGKHSQLGLNYPEKLSLDLTSKRTTHKLAEQGRRNRINNALSELAKLISPTIPTNSKATTVENAVIFLKGLQEELDTVKRRLSKYEEVQPQSVSPTEQRPEEPKTELKPTESIRGTTE